MTQLDTAGVPELNAPQGLTPAWYMFRHSRDFEDCEGLEVRLRLLCDPRVVGARSELAKTDFLMPDRGGGAYLGVGIGDGVRRFEVGAIASRNRKTGRLRFLSPYAHGTPGDEFLYLAWKPAGQTAPPWVWRIKMPLASLTWARVQQGVDTKQHFEFDATGRVPHDSATVVWRPV